MIFQLSCKLQNFNRNIIKFKKNCSALPFPIAIVEMFINFSLDGFFFCIVAQQDQTPCLVFSGSTSIRSLLRRWFCGGGVAVRPGGPADSRHAKWDLYCVSMKISNWSSLYSSCSSTSSRSLQLCEKTVFGPCHSLLTCTEKPCLLILLRSHELGCNPVSLD